jgi:hypothetical protein
MSKNVVGPQMTLQYGAYALKAGQPRLHARKRMHASTRPDTHTYARTDKYVILIAFPRQTRVSITLYVHWLSFSTYERSFARTGLEPVVITSSTNLEWRPSERVLMVRTKSVSLTSIAGGVTREKCLKSCLSELLVLCYPTVTDWESL